MDGVDAKARLCQSADQEVSEIFRNATEANQRFASLYTPKSDELTDERARDLLWNALLTL